MTVAIDPGKVSNRVWLNNGSGPLAEPASLPVSRTGIAGLKQLVIGASSRGPVVASEATAVCIGLGRRSWNGGLRLVVLEVCATLVAVAEPPATDDER